MLNIGTAVMGPEVYLKALSMARNVAHQRGRTINHFTTAVFDLVPLDEGSLHREEPKSDPKYYRPSEVHLLKGDYSKARKLLGWEPKVNFEALVVMMIDADWELAKKERLLADHGMKI